ncbi:hypothetical protein FB45DRAFT_890991, partial [Roridomyces roridus]
PYSPTRWTNPPLLPLFPPPVACCGPDHLGPRTRSRSASTPSARLSKDLLDSAPAVDLNARQTASVQTPTLPVVPRRSYNDMAVQTDDLPLVESSGPITALPPLHVDMGVETDLAPLPVAASIGNVSREATGRSAAVQPRAPPKTGEVAWVAMDQVLEEDREEEEKDEENSLASESEAQGRSRRPDRLPRHRPVLGSDNARLPVCARKSATYYTTPSRMRTPSERAVFTGRWSICYFGILSYIHEDMR